MFRFKMIMILFSFYGLLHAQDNIVQNIDKLMNECQNLDLFSGTILVAKDGKTIYENSFGFSDKESNILNTNDTKYNIGSIGKLFTKIMILQLFEEGKLSFDDNLSKYLKYFPVKNSDKVTIKHLLTMTSGYGDYIQNPEFQKDKDKFKKLDDLLHLISKEELNFEPGTDKMYSNSGYAILGGIIESITGKDYETNLKERILNRLDMNSSGFIYWDENDPKKAIGYIKGIKGDVRNNRNLRLHPSPAGGLYATAEDLLRLDISLRNDNKILKDDTKVLLFGDIDNSKITWNELKNNKQAVDVYAGGAPGINAIYGVYIGLNYTVIILSNYDHAAEELEKSLTNIILGKEYENPKLPLGNLLYKLYKENGADFIDKNFESILKDNNYKIGNDMLLNMTGYQFLQEGMTDAAIVIFQKNVSLFPDVANCYDSLGEALFNAGKYAEAKTNYEKVIQMQPNNVNAKLMLEKIKNLQK